MSGRDILPLGVEDACLGDVVPVLRAAEPPKKAELYGELGLNLTYEPNGRRVLVEADLSRVRKVRVGGGI